MFSENAVLLRRVGEGDESAVDEIVSLNMGLVKNIAVRFRDRGVEFEDLVQIGVIGMIKAIRSYDFTYNTAFSTYAVPLIIGEIRRFLRDDGPIKVGRGIKKQGINVMKQREDIIKKQCRKPKVSELAEICTYRRRACSWHGGESLYARLASLRRRRKICVDSVHRGERK